MNLDEVQANILTGVFGKKGGDSNHFMAVASSRIAGFTKPSFDFLWKKAVKHHKKTDDIISWEIFRRMIRKSGRLTDDIKRLYLAETKQLFSKRGYRRVKNNSLVKYSIEELNTIQRQTMFTDIIYEHMAALNTHEIEDVDEFLNQTLGRLNTKLLSSGQPDYVIVDYAGRFDKRQAERKREKENPDTAARFRYRYKGLQSVFVKGHRPGDVVILSGITGVGKSIMSGDITTTAADQRLNVVYFSAENMISQVCGRLDSNVTGYEYDVVQAYGFDSDKDRNAFEKIFNKKLKSSKRIQVVKVSPNGFTILTVIRALHELETKHNFKADVVVLDSPDLMRPSIELNTNAAQFTRLASTAVYWDIKGLAVDRSLIIFCTSQLTREAGKRKNMLEVSAEDVAEDYNKVRICDAMLILVETIDMAMSNLLAVKIGKNRDGRKPVEPIMLLADKARMRFYNADGSEAISQEDTKSTKVAVTKLRGKNEGFVAEAWYEKGAA